VTRAPLAALAALALGVFAAGAVGFACLNDPPPTRLGPKTAGDDDDALPPARGDDDDDMEPLDGGIKPPSDPPLPDGGKPLGRVYAHTEDTLYVFEPLHRTLTLLGKFACLDGGDSMIDVALDRTGAMYGTSFGGFLRIDPLSAACSYVKRDTAAGYPNSLAFVPLGTVDPTKEALVGYQYDPDAVNQATVYVRIDLVTGALSKIGTLNDPGAAVKFKSSGDLVALIRNGNRAFLTVHAIIDEAGTGKDQLAEVDPTTGRIKSILGDNREDAPLRASANGPGRPTRSPTPARSSRSTSRTPRRRRS